MLKLIFIIFLMVNLIIKTLNHSQTSKTLLTIKQTIMKLQNMTDFVLEQRMTSEEINKASFFNIQTHIHSYYDKVFAYANFLKQPLTLQMFVPVDSHGVISEDLQFCCSSPDCGCMGMPVNVSSMDEIDEYYEAKEKVLFKGFEVKESVYDETGQSLFIGWKNTRLWI